ncbi:hypothetical protein CYMTET_32255 [Cymbomonas tetramitiformis]|uniref:Uncharacterized protein n=1 Tax=Cymbomonas tetramitiformis TaxID=36881 RepID=A0AAE0FFE9_9CHLO|nr:hypothetical protein CYMTET_32255 [Cymbomonas tetramitiformis]
MGNDLGDKGEEARGIAAGDLAQPDRPTTKADMLGNWQDILIEFQKLGEAVQEDLPGDLEGPTEDLVEAQGAGVGDGRAGHAGCADRQATRRRELAWATGARGMQDALTGRRRELAWATGARGMQDALTGRRPGAGCWRGRRARGACRMR